MAQAKKKTATKTAKKTQSASRQAGSRANTRTNKQQQSSNMFFVISMSMLAATLLFANLLMINV